MGREEGRGGFSLLELLAIILVVAILASISIPTFQRGRDRAHRASDETNLKMLAIAVKLYAHDMGQLPPSLDDLPNQYYARSVQAITCPADGTTPTGFDSNGFPTGGRSYALNSAAFDAWNGSGQGAVAWLRNSANADTVLIFESDDADGLAPLDQAAVARHPRQDPATPEWGRITVGERIFWQ